MNTRRPIRIANCSGFFGDRIAAAREQVEGGPIDVLTGDWLAELTMLILARQRLKHGAGAGYARTFLTQMEQVLGTCLNRGITVVTNAGGLDPRGLADALAAQAGEFGLAPRIAVVTGDDITERLPSLLEAGEPFTNLDTGEDLRESGIQPLTANVYLGARGIAAALVADADVVITGRVTDAAVVLGPAAWWHGWDFDRDLDPMAGAVVAGHVIECGAQATGGNYAFFGDVPGLEHPGFPIAEIAGDGSSVITKHDGTGGLVSPGTVTAQLLYEIGGPAYANPDVTARFDTIALEQMARDRVRISGVRGEAPPERLKVSMNYLGGFRNTITLVLTGLDIEAKADLAVRTITGLSLAQAQAGSSPRELAAASGLGVDELDVTFVPRDTTDAPTAGLAQAHLHLTAKSSDPRTVGKPFTAPVVESALGSYPGMFPTAPPATGTPFGVYWPTTVAANAVRQTVTLEGKELAVLAGGGVTDAMPRADVPEVVAEAAQLAGPTVRLPFGALVGARSGDKGGNANIGIWVPGGSEGEAVAMANDELDAMVSPVLASVEDMAELMAEETPLVPDADAEARATQTYGWLLGFLTPARVAELLPEAAGLPIDVHALPNLRAVNVVIHGLLGRGVSDCTRLDPQAKGLAEQLRARVVDAPAALVEPA
jgi:hypothetical protein